MNSQSLYYKLPVKAQNIVCSLKGLQIQSTRFSRSFDLLLEEVESRTFWSNEQIQTYRDIRLRAFVEHCYRTVPYYRRKFTELGLLPCDIMTLNDLQKLPILTKRQVQNNISEFVSTVIPLRNQIEASTSGSTGSGLRFYSTLKAIQEQWAVWWRYRHLHGLHTGIWCGHFAGQPIVNPSENHSPFWRYNIPGKMVYFSANHISPLNMPAYIEELRSKRLVWLHGYPSLLTLLATYILEKGVNLGYHVQWITVGAENLLPSQASLISQAFGIMPKQHYGLAEAVANISECEAGQLHVDEDFSAVEFVPNPYDASYRIVGCNLSNLATPLLRYDSQDIVTLSDVTCSCGHPGRVVESIDGRAEDYVVLKNGTRIGRLFHLMADSPHICESQIYQQQQGQITIKIVCGPQFGPEDEAALMKRVYSRFGKELDVYIQYVDSLERTRTGKLRFVISDLKDGQLDRLEK